MEARKTAVRRHLANGFNRDDISKILGISKAMVVTAIENINREDKVYIHDMKEDEIASDVLIMKDRFLKIYRDSRIMYAKIKDDPNTSLRDKTELLRFMGEISAAILKIDVEGIELVRKGRLPADVQHSINKVEGFVNSNKLDSTEIIKIEATEVDNQGVDSQEDTDPQKVF